MRVAIVHDWFVTYAGSERVVEQLIALFPQADVFSLIDFLSPSDRRMLAGKRVTTTFLQHLPLARRHYSAYLPLMPLAIEQLNLSNYDLVLSSSHCVAKGVLTGPDQLHVSYIHTPMRYAWDAQHEYLAERGLTRGLRSAAARLVLHKMRLWDARTAAGVDSMVANSHFIARRIWKVYGREAKVIYPPVDITPSKLPQRREDFYVTASRLVPYKNVGILVEAFSRMPSRRLVVIGDGPLYRRLARQASPNVTLVGYQSPEAVKQYLEQARAFLFAAREDFGIAMVEAQAAGTPVIAYGQGGSLETIRPLGVAKPTGMLFSEQTADHVMEAVTAFERQSSQFNPADCRENAARFGVERFHRQFYAHVMDQWNQFRSGQIARHSPADLPEPATVPYARRSAA